MVDITQARERAQAALKPKVPRRSDVSQLANDLLEALEEIERLINLIVALESQIERTYIELYRQAKEAPHPCAVRAKGDGSLCDVARKVFEIEEQAMKGDQE